MIEERAAGLEQAIDDLELRLDLMWRRMEVLESLVKDLVTILGEMRQSVTGEGHHGRTQ